MCDTTQYCDEIWNYISIYYCKQCALWKLIKFCRPITHNSCVWKKFAALLRVGEEGDFSAIKSYQRKRRFCGRRCKFKEVWSLYFCVGSSRGRQEDCNSLRERSAQEKLRTTSNYDLVEVVETAPQL